MKLYCLTLIDLMNALKKDDPEKARKCLSYYQMQETDKGIYG